MSTKTPERRRRPHSPAPLFAALGDETRLSLISKLSHGSPRSISQLASGSRLTRQAVTKHLHVLQRAGLVENFRRGRRNLFRLDPRPIDGLKSYLDLVSQKWDHTLSRLKSFVEE